MFDSQFEEIVHHSFPKTDINFYMLSNNSSSLQPWNKTSYPQKPDFKKIINTIKPRAKHLSFDAQQTFCKTLKRKASEDNKCHVPLSTLTFYVRKQNETEKTLRKNNTASSILRAKKLSQNQQKLRKQKSVDVVWSDNICNRGWTNSLKHTALLKIKQEHQNKIKQIISKKQIQNKINVPKIRKGKKPSFGQNYFGGDQISINEMEICSQQLVPIRTNEFVRKPKKVFYVGVRKFLGANSQKQRQT